MHRLWADSRVLHLAQGHDELGGLSWGGKRMQCAHGFHLRRRTAYLSVHRGAGGRIARAATDRLHLHQRHVHAQEDARMDGLAVGDSAGICRGKSRYTARFRVAERKRCDRNSQGTKRSGKANYWSDQMDVLERASRWLGANTRSDRGTRRRLQGMHSRNQNGEAARLSSGDERNDLQGNRYAGDRTDVRLSFRSWRGWSHHHPWIRLRRRQERHDQTAQPAPGKLLSYPRNDGREVPKSRRVDESLYLFGHADLFRVSCRETGSDLFGMGDSDSKYPRLERPMLSDDRRTLLELRGVTGKDDVGSVWRRQRSCARQPMRELHGALRLRADRDFRTAIATRRHLENGQVQFRLETETLWAWQRSARLQWCELR